MTAHRWARIKEVFQAALELSGESRDAFLAAECDQDPELYAEVVSLLDANADSESFLSTEDLAVETLPLSAESADRQRETLLKRCPHCDARFSLSSLLCPVDGEVLIEDASTLVGTTLDDTYLVERMVGQGAFGSVFQARHTLLDDIVAVKVLRSEVSSNPDLLRRFLREGKAARAIQHPNVVAIHDLRTTSSGLAFMVLEYVEGETLRALLGRKKVVDVDQLLKILGPIAAALDHAHQNGIIHRDVKPENIMVDVNGSNVSAKLLDLGLAKLRELSDDVQKATALTIPGQYLGSPAYMSPEQWGEPQPDASTDIDHRADIYSLGVIAYEALTGEQPFRAGSLGELRKAHVEHSPPLASERAAGVSRRMALVIAQALDKDRNRRPESASEFHRQLVEAAADSTPDDAPAVRARRSPKIIAAAFSVLVFACASGVYWRLNRQPIDAPVDSESARPTVKAYLAMTDEERFAFVDEHAREVSREMSGFEYTFPPDARLNIKKAVDRYAERVGSTDTRIGREDLREVFKRGRVSLPLIHQIFDQAGIPAIIGTYLPMIESEFRNDALSSHGAVGMFQMLPTTASVYGGTKDDLLDTERSAVLASRYLKDQMAAFEHDRMAVPLSVAAYNRGSKGIAEYLQAVVVLDDREAELRFWALIQNSNSEQLPNAENTRYVASFFAAAIVGENPASFGIEDGPLSAAK